MKYSLNRRWTYTRFTWRKLNISSKQTVKMKTAKDKGLKYSRNKYSIL